MLDPRTKVAEATEENTNCDSKVHFENEGTVNGRLEVLRAMGYGSLLFLACRSHPSLCTEPVEHLAFVIPSC